MLFLPLGKSERHRFFFVMSNVRGEPPAERDDFVLVNDCFMQPVAH